MTTGQQPTDLLSFRMKWKVKDLTFKDFVDGQNFEAVGEHEARVLGEAGHDRVAFVPPQQGLSLKEQQDNYSNCYWLPHTWYLCREDARIE